MTIVALNNNNADVSASNASSISTSMSVTAGGTNTVAVARVVVGKATGALTIGTPTYNSVGMTAAGAQVSEATDNSGLKEFVLPGPATGSNTLACSITGGPANSIYIDLTSYTHVDQTTPVRAGSYTTFNGSNGAGASASVAVPSAVGDMTTSCTTNGDGLALISSTNQTIRNKDNTGTTNFGSDDAAGAATVTHTWTYDTANNTKTMIAGFSLQLEQQAPVIITQPSDTTVNEGATARFTVVTDDGSPTTYTYQWQKQEYGTTGWANVGGATNYFYDTAATVKSTDDYDQYRVNVTSSGGTTTSSAVTLRVNTVQSSYAGVGWVVGSSLSFVGDMMVGATDSSHVSTAALTKTLGALTSVATATESISATVAKTLGALTSVATATESISAQATLTLGALTSVATATESISGQLAATLGTLAVAATATEAISAALAKTLGAVTILATATESISATATPTLGALTSVATATESISATATPTLGALTSVATDTESISAVLSQTLGAVTTGATATEAISASLAQTLGALTEASVAAESIGATLGQTLGAVTGVATATESVSAALAKSLGDATLNASATLSITTQVTQALAPLAEVSSAANGIGATLTRSLDAIQISSVAALAIAAQLAQGTLGAATLDSQATVAGGSTISAALTQTLGALGLLASATGLAPSAPAPSASQTGGGVITRPPKLRQPELQLRQPQRVLMPITAQLSSTLEDMTIVSSATVGWSREKRLQRIAAAMTLMH